MTDKNRGGGERKRDKEKRGKKQARLDRSKDIERFDLSVFC